MKSDPLAKFLPDLERVKGIEPSYSALKSTNFALFSMVILTFLRFWPIEITPEFRFVRMATVVLVFV
jgi:hypothetical protein